MISLCKIFNTYTYNRASKILLNVARKENDNSFLDNTIRKYFSIYQLRLIEDCFESNYHSDSIRFIESNELPEHFDSVSGKIGIIFGKEFPESKDRLLAILYNMIHNNGIFKPLQEISLAGQESIMHLESVKRYL